MLEGTFEPEELAYLALTSKVEGPLRDRLAFRLRQRLDRESGLAVAREWKRFDLAVVTEAGEAQLLLEAKAMVSFDLWENPRKFQGYCASDREKMLEAASRAESWPTLLTLAFVAHPHRPHDIPKHWDGVVKYLGRMRRHAEKSMDDAEAEILRVFPAPAFPPIASGRIHGGCAFGTVVSVLYGLFGPYGQPSVV